MGGDVGPELNSVILSDSEGPIRVLPKRLVHYQLV